MDWHLLVQNNDQWRDLVNMLRLFGSTKGENLLHYWSDCKKDNELWG